MKKTVALLMVLGLPIVAGAQDEPNGQTPNQLVPLVSAPVASHSFDGDLAALPKVREWTEGTPVKVVPRRRPDIPPPPVPEFAEDSVRQRDLGEGRIPSPTLNFAGIGATGAYPPDVAGDVGPNHYIQMVNVVFAVYSKAGVLLAGPSNVNTLWAGFGGPCQTSNDGDPIVLYDPIADRWLMSQFADTLPPHQCVAVSKTPNPISGGYWLYDFTMTDFPDYPKFGVWPDAYYMGANAIGPNVFAFNRSQMLVGGPAGMVSFSPAAIGYHSVMLPSDLDGPRLPPAGAPNYFYRFVDGTVYGGADRIEVFGFHVDWAIPANSTFTGPTTLAHAPFASLCGFSFDCIRQPVTAQLLDSITEWPMWRLQYRNHGDHETLVSNHAVNVGGDQAGVRWFELLKVGAGTWTVRQDATWAPDTDSRWMGSIAQDFIGNMAVGYSVSSTTTEPSLRYSGRLDGDTLNSMTQGEGVIAAGGGHQTGSNRWGDYHSMSVDPVDDCTFWFSGEYYAVTSSVGWVTRIASFKFPLCGDLIFRNGFNYGT